jgi:hypothetical protein
VNNLYFKCGCSIIDMYESSNWITQPILRRCKRHQKDMKPVSWLTWAKTFAPAQYKRYIKER